MSIRILHAPNSGQLARSPAQRRLEWRARGFQRHVEDAQLRPVLALPAIERQAACGMQHTAAVLEQGFAERLVRGAEGDRLHASAIAGFEPRANVPLPDLLGMHEDM